MQERVLQSENPPGPVAHRQFHRRGRKGCHSNAAVPHLVCDACHELVVNCQMSISGLCSNAVLMIVLGDDGEPAAYEVLLPDAVTEPLVSPCWSCVMHAAHHNM